MPVKVISDRSRQFRNAFKALAQDRILIGIPAEAAARTPEPGEGSRPLDNAEIGYLNEFGAPEINLPARSHLVPGIKRVQPKIAAALQKACAKAADGDFKGIHDIQTQIGFMAVSSVKSLISEGVGPPLAESTIAERKRRGVSRTTPLQDTGQYRNSITFVIRPAKGVKRLGK